MKLSNMLKAGLVCLATGACMICGAGVPITWNGNGATSAWSDGANWEGGNAPGNGDTAVIPNGSVAYMSSADITWVASQGLAVISLPGADSTLYITNNTAGTLSVPVSGIGKFNVANNAKQLSLGANNSNFTGPFYFTNSIVHALRDYNECLGKYNVVTNFTKPNGALAIFIASKIYNTFHLFGADFYMGTSICTLSTYSSALNFCGPIYTYDSFCIVAQQGTTPTISGGLHHSGVDKLHLFNSTMTVSGDTPCSFESTTSSDAGLNIRNTMQLFSPIDPATARIAFGGGTLKFLKANLLPATTTLLNGWSNSGSNSMIIDLNGFDQQCGSILKWNNTGQTEDNTYITSYTNATLTVYGQVQTRFSPGSETERYMAFSLRGAASLDFNGTNVITYSGQRVWPKMEIRSCPTKSDTTGGLCVRRGTLTLAEDTYWPNLSRLEAHDEGLLVMNTDGVNTNGFVFVVSNVVNGAVTIAAGKTLHAKTAYVGRWLDAGEYGGAEAGLDAKHTLPQLGGSGTLRVAEYGGPKGLFLIFR